MVVKNRAHIASKHYFPEAHYAEEVAVKPHAPMSRNKEIYYN